MDEGEALYPSIKPQERPAFIGGPFSARRRDNPATCSHPRGAQTTVLLYVSPSAILIPSKCVAVVPQLASYRKKQTNKNNNIIVQQSNCVSYRTNRRVWAGPRNLHAPPFMFSAHTSKCSLHGGNWWYCGSKPKKFP